MNIIFSSKLFQILGCGTLIGGGISSWTAVNKNKNELKKFTHLYAYNKIGYNIENDFKNSEKYECKYDTNNNWERCEISFVREDQDNKAIKSELEFVVKALKTPNQLFKIKILNTFINVDANKKIYIKNKFVDDSSSQTEISLISVIAFHYENKKMKKTTTQNTHNFLVKSGKTTPIYSGTWKLKNKTTNLFTDIMKFVNIEEIDSKTLKNTKQVLNLSTLDIASKTNFHTSFKKEVTYRVALRGRHNIFDEYELINYDYKGQKSPDIKLNIQPAVFAINISKIFVWDKVK